MRQEVCLVKDSMICGRVAAPAGEQFCRERFSQEGAKLRCQAIATKKGNGAQLRTQQRQLSTYTQQQGGRGGGGVSRRKITKRKD